MKITLTKVPEVLLIEPQIFEDARGFFFESFNQRAFSEATGMIGCFVQDNHSRSVRGVLRGLHYQLQPPQGKLVRVVRGAIFDVAVDVRMSSRTFGHWVGVKLTEDNHQQVWIPPGFAHGFQVLSDYADVLYKVTAYYSPDQERCIRWDDPDLAIEWPGTGLPVLSDRDENANSLRSCELPG